MNMATVYGDMQSACRERMLSWGGLPTVAWEGVVFTPPVGVPWIREKFSPVSATPRGVGTKALVEHIGLLILDVFVVANNGIAELNSLTGGVLALFPPGQPLVYGDNVGSVIEAARGQNYQQPGWLRSTITVRVNARTYG
jgi:hypothetical protein